jgi:PBP1b-binding outer membrane lipoprotein LpoB
MFLGGCAAPQMQNLSRTQVLHPDEDDDLGGTFLESGDIRSIATQMSGAILSTPEISRAADTVRITMAPIRNSTRFIIDKDIFMKRLRIELNKVANGRVRFFSQGVGQETRREILAEQDEAMWDSLIDEVAEHIVNSAAVSSSSEPPAIAVIPVRNTNLVDLNADSFTALVRARIAEKAGGKLMFLAREKNGKVIEEILDEEDVKALGLVKARRMKDLYGADFFLGGEFIAQDLSASGMSISLEETVGRSADDPRILEHRVEKKEHRSNVTKYLNVWLIDAETGGVPVEKLIKIERKMTSGLGRSDYLLTGELNGLSKAAQGGVRSDYLLMSFQLVDPVTNEILWEDAYETKKKSSTSTLYR